MSLDRALGIGRVFDAYPDLRPMRVGGDPARIKVGASMERVIAEQGLPIRWWVAAGKKPVIRDLDFSLYTGRDGYVGMHNDNGEWEYLLCEHEIGLTYPGVTASTPGLLNQVSALFADLAVAFDAAYGYVRGEGQSRFEDGYGNLLDTLENVFWLNYFGRAFVARWPELAMMDAAHPVPNGGVIVETTRDPWPPRGPSEGRFDAPWKAPLLAVLGTDPFTTDGQVPTIAEHFAACPGTEEMPWESAERERNEQARERTYQRARSRRLALTDDELRVADAQASTAESKGEQEWSSSFDLVEWKQFFTRLRRRLRGDLVGDFGTALAREIAAAPHNTEDSVHVQTTHGPVTIGWFIDDIHVVDFTVIGTADVVALCDRLFEPTD